ncbi:MAG: hypothetical protein N3D09_04200 [Archaeoglobaceae archaeon]|nr:hypothetical protein [Archaeoglobaceae archaeon]
MMKDERIVQKWRLIRLSKTRPLLVFRLVSILSEKCGEEVYKIAFDYGKERGEEVARNLWFSKFDDVSKFLSMIAGVRIEQKSDNESILTPCPLNTLEHVKSERICKGYIEGFFSAFGFRAEVLPKCGEPCHVVIRRTHS